MRHLIFCCLLACSPSASDVEGALTWSESMNAGNVANTTCGFPTFGLDDVKVEGLQIDGKSGTATVTGTAKEGPKKGTACKGNISFHYTRGRSVTQGATGKSVSYDAVILDVTRKE